jgi:glycerol kinase
MPGYILAIDQGTTSSRAIVFDKTFKNKGQGQQEFKQHFPKPGWVEHDAEEIWKSVLATARAAIRKARAKASDIKAIGITNQRETVVVWDRKTGKPIHRAIVWQDRRTADLCAKLKSEGHEPLLNAKTGLLLDPYSARSTAFWFGG